MNFILMDDLVATRNINRNLQSDKVTVLNNGSVLLTVCLNLKHRQDRRYVIEFSLFPAIPSLQFFESIDARNMPSKRLNRWNIKKTAYAVNLSKRLVIRQFLKTNADYLLIFEDDVIIKDDFLNALNRLVENCKNNWGMLFLGGAHMEKPLETDNPLIVKCTKTYLNHAWIVNRPFAKQILSALSKKPFTHPYSDQTIASLQSIIPTYAPKNWMAFPRLTMSNNTGGVRGIKYQEYRKLLNYRMHADEFAVIRCSIKLGARILEWGAGYHTILAAMIAGPNGKIDSIDHNHLRAKNINATLIKRDLFKHAQVHLAYQKQGEEQIHPSRYNTAAVPESLKSSYDICIIDGWNRIQFAIRSAKFLKPGALLFFPDFSQMPNPKLREQLPLFLHKYQLKFEILHTPRTMAVFTRL